MTSSDGTAPLTPATNAERLHALDILRGLALFGMVLVHFHQRIEKPTTGVEDLVGWVVWVAVEQKSWGTFAILFGVGFAVLLRRLEERGAAVVPFYLRRLAVLAVFGLIAEAAFGFHILLDYAIWGVPLLFVRRWTDRALVALAVAAVSVRPLLAAAVAVFSLASSGAAAATAGTGNSVTEGLRVAEQQGHYLPLFWARLAVTGWNLAHWRRYLPDVNLALFIVGFLAVRHGVFDEPRRHVRLIVRWMAFGVASWMAWWLVLRQLPDIPIARVDWAVRSVAGLVQEQWLCFAYVGGVALLLAFRPVWERRLALFGFAGRMALTNYMLQAAVLDYMSSSYGLGLRLRPYVCVVATGLLFGAEAAFSRWWLGRYRFGPCEWVWRSLTYGRAQPMRRARDEVGIVGATA